MRRKIRQHNFRARSCPLPQEQETRNDGSIEHALWSLFDPKEM
jgi:hypothetical protein